MDIDQIKETKQKTSQIEDNTNNLNAKILEHLAPEDRLSFNKHYSVNKMICEGGNGIVFKGRQKFSGETLAFKLIPKCKIPRWMMIDQRNTPLECFLLRKLETVQGVVRLKSHYIGIEDVLMVMEYPENTMDLFEYTMLKGRIREDEARNILRQTTNILYECQKADVVHCDIKDENLLINTVTGEITVIDFGAGTFCSEEPYTEFLGTHLYSPPECTLGIKHRAEPLTVWTLGILICNLLNGHPPFDKISEILQPVIRLDASISRDCQDLIGKCLSVNPKNRIKLQSVLHHDWLK